jgi:RNA polymerase sigma-70 factor (ECF subfamily)
MAEKSKVKAAQHGDEAAFTALITDYQPILYNTAWRLLRQEADVADVLQETILKAWQKLPQLREPRYFNTWLYRILINEVQRFKRASPSLPLTDTLPATAPEDQQVLVEAISHLPTEM